jgi:hypothetical protein
MTNNTLTQGKRVRKFRLYLLTLRHPFVERVAVKLEAALYLRAERKGHTHVRRP